MYFDTLDSEQQISFLIKPILKVLQEAGGQLDRAEIRERICDVDERIADFEQKLYTSKKQEISIRSLTLNLILRLKN